MFVHSFRRIEKTRKSEPEIMTSPCQMNNMFHSYPLLKVPVEQVLKLFYYALKHERDEVPKGSRGPLTMTRKKSAPVCSIITSKRSALEFLVETPGCSGFETNLNYLISFSKSSSGTQMCLKRQEEVSLVTTGLPGAPNLHQGPRQSDLGPNAL